MNTRGHKTTERNARVLNHLCVSVLVALVLLPATSAGAHEIDRSRGFYLGASLSGSSIDAADAAPGAVTIDEEGGGLQLRAGYLFNPKFSLELELAGYGHGAANDSVRVGQGTLHINAYYHFRGDRHFRPFIKGGLGGYGLTFDIDGANNPQVTGAGLSFGAGFEYFVSGHVSFDLDVTHHVINYGQIDEDLGGGLVRERDISEDGSLTTLGLGIAVYF